MQGLTQLTIPRFSPAVVTHHQRCWEVSVRVLRNRSTWVVRYWAEEPAAASRAAIGEARNRWKGHTFAVLSVVQVQP